MKDGLYLSVYVNPIGGHRLFDVWLRHDNNMSLWRKSGANIELLQHWELERITGQKEHRTPFYCIEDARGFIDELLQPLRLSMSDMVEIWGTPGLATACDYHLSSELPDLAFHSVSHLYTAMLLDSSDFFGGDVLGLAVDRAPDYVLDSGEKPCWFAGGFSRKGTIDIFPIESPGPLYFEARLRFKMREGTLMALTSATVARGECDLAPLLGAHRMDGPSCFDHARSLLDEIVRQVSGSLSEDPRFSPAESMASAVMKEVQALSAKIMERNIDRAVAKYQIEPRVTTLGLAGGYALNCPTNSYLMRRYGFRRLSAPPCVGDGGQSIGMALAAFHKKISPGKFDFTFPSPYLGRDDVGVDSAVDDYSEFILSVDDLDLSRAIDDIQTSPVVWFNGRAEIGPRALGNRSLIGDPTSLDQKNALNALKRRQWWRPVAPVVLEEYVSTWFEDSRRSPYMLETFRIRRSKIAQVPAIAHLDDTARIQTVSRHGNQAMYELVEAFRSRTSVPMLCNTSLNDKGEPIIDRIREAMNFCLRRKVRVAYFNGRRVEFQRHSAYPIDTPLPRSHERFSDITTDRATLLRKRYNPYGLPDLYVYLNLRDPALAKDFDISTPEGASAFASLVEHRFDEDPEEEARAKYAMMRSGRYFGVYGREVDR